MNKADLRNIGAGVVVGAITSAIISTTIVSGVLSQQDLQANTAGSISDNKPAIKTELPYISEQDLVIGAVEKASPAVVSILITKDVPILEEYYEEMDNPFNSPFFGGQGFNFRVPRYRESGETETQEIGGGSGFLVSGDGYIVTNKHVVEEEGVDYTVFTKDGEEYSAEVIAKDSLYDIALLKIETEDMPFLDFADSDELRVGQSVIAIGNPLLEFQNSVSTGVISGLSRNIIAGGRFFGKAESLEDVIQTDAAINPGNSGGPLLDLGGDVIGVNVAVATAENIGFSIPANAVKSVVDSVKATGKIVRPFLGVRYVQITEQMQEVNDLSVDYGVIVLRGENIEDLAVIPGSPADKAGLQENDIILEIDGQKLDGETSLARVIAVKNIGDEIALKILHKGEEKEVSVILEEPPSEE